MTLSQTTASSEDSITPRTVDMTYDSDCIMKALAPTPTERVKKYLEALDSDSDSEVYNKRQNNGIWMNCCWQWPDIIHIRPTT